MKWQFHPMIRKLVLACGCSFGILCLLALVIGWATGTKEMFLVVCFLGFQMTVTNVAAMHFGGEYVPDDNTR